MSASTAAAERVRAVAAAARYATQSPPSAPRDSAVTASAAAAPLQRTAPRPSGTAGARAAPQRSYERDPVLVGALHSYARPSTAAGTAAAASAAAAEAGRRRDLFVQAKMALMAQINRERREAGVAPLEYDALASYVADAHCQHMADEAFVSHYNSSGFAPFHRYCLGGGRDYVVENLIHLGAAELEAAAALAQSPASGPGSEAVSAQRSPPTTPVAAAATSSYSAAASGRTASSLPALSLAASATAPAAASAFSAHNAAGLGSQRTPERVRALLLAAHHRLMHPLDADRADDSQRRNVLDPFHTHFGIGFSLTSSGHLVMVEEFINRHVVLERPPTTLSPLARMFAITGRVLLTGLSPVYCGVWHEPMPAAMTREALAERRGYQLPSNLVAEAWPWQMQYDPVQQTFGIEFDLPSTLEPGLLFVLLWLKTMPLSVFDGECEVDTNDAVPSACLVIRCQHESDPLVARKIVEPSPSLHAMVHRSPVQMSPAPTGSTRASARSATASARSGLSGSILSDDGYGDEAPESPSRILLDAVATVRSTPGSEVTSPSAARISSPTSASRTSSPSAASTPSSSAEHAQRTAIRDLRGVESLMALLEKDSEIVRGNAAKALFNLALTEELVDRIVQLGGVRRLDTLVRSTNEAHQTAALGCLMNCAAYSEEARHQILRESDALGTSVRVFRDHRGGLGVALGLLQNLALSPDAAVAIVRVHRMVPDLCARLRTTTDASLLASMLGLLVRCLENEPLAREQLQAGRVFDLIVKHLTAMASKDTVLIRCCLVIGHSSDSDDARLSWLQADALNALRRLLADTVLGGFAAGAMAALALSERCATRICQDAAILVTLIEEQRKRLQAHDSVVHNYVAALYNLTVATARTVPPLVDHDVCSVIAQMLRDPDCPSETAAVATALAANCAIHSLEGARSLVRADVAPHVIRLLKRSSSVVFICDLCRLLGALVAVMTNVVSLVHERLLSTLLRLTAHETDEVVSAAAVAIDGCTTHDALLADLIECDGATALVPLLWRPMDETVAATVRVLRRAGQTGRALAVLREDESLQALIALLVDTQKPFMDDALTVLGIALDDTDAATAAEALELTGTLLELLRQRTDSPTLLTGALHALDLLTALVDDSISAFADLEGVELVCSLARTWRSPAVAQPLFRVLTNVSSAESCAKMVARSMSLGEILTHVESKEHGLRAAALTLLANLARYDRGSALELLQPSNLAKITASAGAVKHAVSIAACGVLANLCLDDTHARSLQNGRAARAISAALAPSSSDAVSCAALHALVNLTAIEPSARQPAPEVASRCLGWLQSPVCRTWAAALLCNCALDDVSRAQLPQLNVLDSLVVGAHDAGDHYYALQCLRALTNFAVDERVRGALVGTDCIAAVVEHLRMGSAVRQQTAALLATHLCQTAEHRRALRLNDGITQLVELLGSTDERVQEAASLALAYCADDDQAGSMALGTEVSLGSVRIAAPHDAAHTAPPTCEPIAFRGLPLD